MLEWFEQLIKSRPKTAIAIALALGGYFMTLITPFLTSSTTNFLQGLFAKEKILIQGCSPIRSSLQIVKSTDGKITKTHSANSAPFAQLLGLFIGNQSGKPLNNVELYVRVLNDAGGYIASATFQTSDKIGVGSYKTEQKDGGVFQISLDQLPDKNILFLDIGTVFPSAIYVQLHSDSLSEETVINPGDCYKHFFKLGTTLPETFYSWPSDGQAPAIPEGHWKIDNIENGLGLIFIERAFELNCGDGIYRETVPSWPRTGSIRICNLHFNLSDEVSGSQDADHPLENIPMRSNEFKVGPEGDDIVGEQ